jgi:hypothetical protein
MTQPPDSPLVEQVARVLDPEAWERRDEDLTRRQEWDAGIKAGWGKTTFKQWANRSVRDSLKQARAVLAVLQPLLDERRWRPIESAPKDEFLIGWSASWNRPHQAIFCAEVSRRKRRWAFSSLPGSELGDPPTHWMPLPEPPESKEPK